MTHEELELRVKYAEKALNQILITMAKKPNQQKGKGHADDSPATPTQAANARKLLRLPAYMVKYKGGMRRVTEADLNADPELMQFMRSENPQCFIDFES